MIAIWYMLHPMGLYDGTAAFVIMDRCVSSLFGLFVKRTPFVQVNFSSGRYFGGSSDDLGGKLPFDAGFEVRRNAEFICSAFTESESEA